MKLSWTIMTWVSSGKYSPNPRQSFQSVDCISPRRKSRMISEGTNASGTGSQLHCPWNSVAHLGNGKCFSPGMNSWWWGFQKESLESPLGLCSCLTQSHRDQSPVNNRDRRMSHTHSGKLVTCLASYFLNHEMRWAAFKAPAPELSIQSSGVKLGSSTENAPMVMSPCAPRMTKNCYFRRI